MNGETDLQKLIRSMRPALDPVPYGYASRAGDGTGPLPGGLFARIVEAEGETLVAPMTELAALGLAAEGPLARITLTVHSSLAAVGLTAAFATALGREGISANVVAGFYHDHIFVQWDRAGDAMACLIALAAGA
ncbi:MAG: hypothetical protein RLZZ528_1183 [Pseudomonadota bacterium]